MILDNKPAMLVTWAYTFHAWEMLGMKAWMPAFLAAAAAYTTGSSATAAASLGAGLTAIAYIGSMGGGITGGWLSDRMGRTWTMLALSITSSSCSLLLGWLIGLPLWLLVVISFVYSFTAVGDSSVFSTAVTELVPPRHLGAAYSVRSVLGFGAGAIALAILPAVTIAAWAGTWLFFVQHQYEDAYWARKPEWTYAEAAVYGSSHYHLPKILRWFTGNIGLHHIHHLASGIPNYRLPECYRASKDLLALPKMTMLESLKCARLALFDEAQRRMISFSALKLTA